MKRLSLEEELPLGLGVALSRQPEAMRRFAALPEARRRAVADSARNARTERELQACVDDLLK